MSDVFISYARSTAAQAQAVAEALRGLGYGVWLDDEIPAHRAFAEVIEERLKAAKAVVVIWSAEAAKSEWVQSEADRARADRKLVQLTIDGAKLPMPFDRIQCADMNGWKGDVAAPGWRKVLSSVDVLVGSQADAPLLVVQSVPARPALGPPGNMPSHASSFLGRDRSLAEIATLLDQERMLTLIGVGGVGKTRLATEVAGRAAGAFPDGTWMVEFAALRDATAVGYAVAGVFGVAQQPDRSIEQCLVAWLGQRRLLLILDNCEHLIDAVAHLANDIITRCPNVILMATSREALMIDGERVWAVPSLGFRDGSDSPAVALFVERARSATPDFDLGGEADAVVEICRRLDGIPLAIELAAARTRAMSPSQIRDGLEERFRLLIGGTRGALERHQSLRQTVSWSYEMLTAAEQAALCRCAVFAGEFTLEAAQAVCAGGDIEAFEVLDLLDSLVRKSLMTALRRDRVVRYGQLETIRQFGEEQLAAAGGGEATRARHARYFADDSGARFRQWLSPLEREAYEWLDREMGNLRAAFRWACDNRQTDIAAVIASSVGDMARFRFRVEAAGWAGEIVDAARAERHPRLIYLLTWAASSAWAAQDMEAAKRYGAEAVALLDDPHFEPFAWIFSDLAAVAQYEGHAPRGLDFAHAGAAHPADQTDRFCLAFAIYVEAAFGNLDDAMAMAKSALPLCEATGIPMTIAIALLGFGRAFAEHEPAVAQTALERGVAVSRDGGNLWTEMFLLGQLTSHQTRHAEPAAALGTLRRCLEIWPGSTELTATAATIGNLIVLLDKLGGPRDCALLFGALGAGVDLGLMMPGFPAAVARSRTLLGDAAFEDLRQAGASLSPAEAFELTRTLVRNWLDTLGPKAAA